MRSQGLKADRPAKPPEPVEKWVFMQGGKPCKLRRCHYWDMREPKPGRDDDRTRYPINGKTLVFHQCRKAVRKGSKACGYHGGGFAKREKRGEATNPLTVGLITGDYARDEVLDQWTGRDPHLDELYRRHLNGNLLDLRPPIAKARALLDYFAEKADLEKTETLNGSDPPSLRYITAHSQLAAILEKYITIQQKAGEVLATSEVLRLFDAVATIFGIYVPPANLEQALTDLRRLMQRVGDFPSARSVRSSGAESAGAGGHG